MVGRLVHYAIDAALVSTVLAGIKRSTGLTVAVDKIENSTFRSAMSTYLSIGDYCFDKVVEGLKGSGYSKKD
ncbi:DUF1748-domain-containing protein [Basidiobolus meristosporus CBS 931.73]|uniref:DUF1748-domain-containing protein n=1 Tax=Basidiobolus meristosporus CBS 931.73 TaxID=1314790 RepID=A0A1Y1Z6T7_9FUNG|nr:DUF1748-domain-containing protein [Basidiobolus meristosporus CBS 931.73]|eukprot:ORY05525.1 DUF1748-domain-containing protein [Basidiobolus meristosporus CBS 931.73]